ncbi:uncharacterized protein LOC106179844 [Lingula anatina]|uniref:Uncharacterized protein LOC106179844 n=1 Tax=Lingula anatina TaxID=7574 RepID=A0A1S3K9G6_LINAN|nr:uncharacterized protein LOC106179844 [Lingula anatina]|eukprot:XP_013419084.1 uncharacterized protein LOC106179844 [Lingula anatina]
MGTGASIVAGEVLKETVRILAVPDKSPRQSQKDQRQKAIRQRELDMFRDRCLQFAEFLKRVRATNYEQRRKEIHDGILYHLRKPYGCFRNREQRLILGDDVTELGLVSLLVDYYKASLDFFDIKAVTYYEDGTEWTTELSNLRSFFWDYSDASPQFAEQLARSGYLELMMKDLDAVQLGIQNNTLQENVRYCVQNAILLNVSWFLRLDKLFFVS